MAKYSTFKYGDGTKYGAGEQDANLLWGFIVAWDGYYGWGNEANKMLSLTVRRGRQGMIAADGRGFAPFPPGEATAIFDNSDGRYDPYNSSSPIYGHITPGKFVRIKVRDEANTITYEIMRGVISDIQPADQGDKRRVRITVVDGLRWLMDRKINVGLNTSMDKDLAPSRITVFADWPTDEWPKSYGDDSTEFAYWWAWDQNAFEALKEFNDAEGAVAFHSRDGRFAWRPRDYTHLRSTAIDQSEILSEIGSPQPWEIVRNIIRVNVQTKYLDEINDVIWTMRDIPAIAAGETFYVEPIFRYTDWQPCGSAISFSHTVNAQADGGGADLTDDCALTYLTQIGEGAQLWLTNNSGTDGYITAFTATGDAIYVPNVDIREASDNPSQAAYGPRALAINSRWVEDSVHAQTIADWLLSELKDPAIHPIIQIEARPAKQFTPDLWDAIVLTADELGISAVSYRVGHIEHRTIGEGCQGVRTTFRLEPYMVEGDEEVAYKGCAVYRSSAQTLANNTETDIEWNAEHHDVTGWHNPASNPEKVTVPAGMDGYYNLYCVLQWEGSAANTRYIDIQVNGSGLRTAIASDISEARVFDQHLRITQALSAGDVIEVVAKQDSGGNLDVQTDSMLVVDFIGSA